MNRWFITAKESHDAGGRDRRRNGAEGIGVQIGQERVGPVETPRGFG